MDTIFILVISKGAQLGKKCKMKLCCFFFVLLCFFAAHHLVTLYICTKFHENILDGITVIEWTRFSFEIIP